MQLGGVQQNNFYGAEDLHEILEGLAPQTQEVKGSKGVDKAGSINETANTTGQQRTVAEDLKGAPRIVEPKPNPFDAFETKLSLEALIDLVSDKNAAINSASAKKALQVSSNERQVQNENRLKELDTQIQKIEEQQKMSTIQKIMSKISAFFQVLAAVVSVIVAVVFPNPLTIAAATLASVCAFDNALNAFSDGKISMAAGLEAIDKACGGNGEVGQYLAMAVTLALSIAQSICTSLSPTTAMTGAANIIKNINSFAQIGYSVTEASTNVGTSVYSAVLDRDIKQAEANTMMIQAMLQQLDTSTERQMEEIKDILQHSQDLTSGLEEILENLNAGLKSAATAV